jgi:hypothetical protein
MNGEHRKQRGWRSQRLHARGLSRWGRGGHGRFHSNQPLAPEHSEDWKEQFIQGLFVAIEACRDAGIPPDEVEQRMLEGLHEGYDRSNDPPNKERIARDEEVIRAASSAATWAASGTGTRRRR